MRESKQVGVMGCLLFGIFLLSGCIDLFPSEGYYIEVSFVLEEKLKDYSGPFLNVTQMDLSAYPTLQQALTQLRADLQDPSSNIPSCLLEISEDEYERIRFKLINPEDGPNYSLIIYYQYHFSIGWVVT